MTLHMDTAHPFELSTQTARQTALTENVSNQCKSYGPAGMNELVMTLLRFCVHVLLACCSSHAHCMQTVCRHKRMKRKMCGVVIGSIVVVVVAYGCGVLAPRQVANDFLFLSIVFGFSQVSLLFKSFPREFSVSPLTNSSRSSFHLFFGLPTLLFILVAEQRFGFHSAGFFEDLSSLCAAILMVSRHFTFLCVSIQHEM